MAPLARSRRDRQHDRRAFRRSSVQSALRLYAEKRGTEFGEPDDNAILRRGRKLEPVVARDVVDQRPQWFVTKAEEYLRNPSLRIGATPDYLIAEPSTLRCGVLQIKTAMPHIIERDWKGGTEPPLWILLQASTEMMLENAHFAAVAVMNVGDYKTTIFEIPRNLAVEAKIILAVGEFWKRVELGIEPEPDFGRDRDVLRALHPKAEPGKVVDLRSSNEVADMLARRAKMTAENKANDEAIEEDRNRFGLSHERCRGRARRGFPRDLQIRRRRRLYRQAPQWAAIAHLGSTGENVNQRMVELVRYDAAEKSARRSEPRRRG